MLCLDQLVNAKHQYRKFKDLFDFRSAAEELKSDEARKQKYGKLNNETLPEVAHDKQAKIGFKGGSNFWYGYKKHVSVDIQSGLINKVVVTPANVTDAREVAHVLPSGRRGLC